MCFGLSGGMRRTQIRKNAIDLRTSSGSRCVCLATISSCVRSARQETLPRIVVSQASHAITNELHLRTTLSKHRSAALPL